MGNAHKTHDFPAKLNNNGNMTNDQTDSRVVESCKRKLSTDANELSMYIVKRIIGTIVTPITHICNISFKKRGLPRQN